MAIIKCGECGGEISDKAASCPKCGAPISNNATPIPEPTKKKAATSSWAWAILLLLIVGGAYLFMSPTVQNANKPDMPVDVKYRPALTGPGLVLAVTNNSDRQLTLLATFDNPTLRQEKTFQINVAPHRTSEVGHLEGWSFASGDTIRITHNDYKTWSGNIP